MHISSLLPIARRCKALLPAWLLALDFLAGAAPIALAGCQRDLDMPSQLPPSVSKVEPSRGWAGSVLTVYGQSLGDVATTKATMLGVPAEVLSVSSQGDALTLLVPDDLPAGTSTQPVITTPAGSNAPQVTATFTSLGLGHPRDIALHDTIPLGPSVTVASVLGGRAFVMDDAHNIVRVMDAATGDMGPSFHSLRSDDIPALAFGTADQPFIYSAGFSGEMGSLSAWSYDTDGRVKDACPELSASSSLPIGPSDSCRGNALSSPSGRVMAVPEGDDRVLLATATCPPVLSEVAFRAALGAPTGTYVLWAMPISDTSVVALVVYGADARSDPQHFVRVDLGAVPPRLRAGGTLEAAARYMDWGVVPWKNPVPALHPSGDRFVYPRADGGVGIVALPAGAAPSATGTYTSLASPAYLAWSPDGANLAVGSGAGTVAVLDAASGDLVGSATLPGLQALASLSSESLPQGFLAATSGTVAVLSQTGLVLRQQSLRMNLAAAVSDATDQPISGLIDLKVPITTPDGSFAWLETLVAASGHDKIYASTFPVRTQTLYDSVFRVDGLVSGTTSDVGYAWEDDDDWVWPLGPSGWLDSPELKTHPSGLFVVTVAADSTSSNVAAVAQDDESNQFLELLGSAKAPLPLPLGSVALAWRHGALLVGSTEPDDHTSLERYTASSDGTLVLQTSTPLGDAGSSVLGVWSDDGLSGVLAAVWVPADEADPASVDHAHFALWRDDGSWLYVDHDDPLLLPLALSADGLQMLFTHPGYLGGLPSVDSGLFAIADGQLTLEADGHAVLVAQPAAAVGSATGEAYWVTLPDTEQLVELR
jgi:hypothetical protein